MILNYLCPPALLYAVIMLIYIILELSNEKYHQAFVKMIIGIIFTCILHAFCQMDLGIVSWILVMIPIIFYTYMTLLTFFIFGLNPKVHKETELIKNNTPNVDISLNPSPSLNPTSNMNPSPSLNPTSNINPSSSLNPSSISNPSPSLNIPYSKSTKGTPITTTLYTPTVVPPGSFYQSQNFSPIIPGPSDDHPFSNTK
jgi:hypothetical protein